ncbi:hypothetical protein EDD80_104144 [Anseongella ginsenosidimutans]|uniref:Uncharacterized protein n=1 Tax=Anseongella ginsenosidimutans TaxID=496056 RepID=A0A4R3KRX6_9SPHI|nr:hypothetical protein [Anseongella ginsenosidimutans]QEC53168.1 hypothetical protein FRZ59_13035 [Anseongella ginsenosidimutans]TCS87794.1 hypothetical protein EDD80_104144 [Anseongella ginsenosidimutans]
MKKHLFSALLFIYGAPRAALACDVCEKNQPAALRGIMHGPGPESNLDFIIVAAASIIVLLTLAYSLRYLIRPNENGPEHIKNIVIEK